MSKRDWLDLPIWATDAAAEVCHAKPGYNEPLAVSIAKALVAADRAGWERAMYLAAREATDTPSELENYEKAPSHQYDGGPRR